MENLNQFESIRSQVKPALQSKLEEFRLLGYDSIDEAGIWEFLLKKKWKKAKAEIKIYEVIQDILSIRVSDYISFATIEALKDTEFSFNNEDEWDELFK